MQWSGSGSGAPERGLCRWLISASSYGRTSLVRPLGDRACGVGDGRGRSAWPCRAPLLISPASMRSIASSGRSSSRTVFTMSARLRRSRFASTPQVIRRSSRRVASALSCSMGLRSSRTRFSMRASSSDPACRASRLRAPGWSTRRGAARRASDARLLPARARPPPV